MKKQATIEESSWCRHCSKLLPLSDFYESTDMGKIDKNGKMSLCKNCINSLYQEFFEEKNSIEKAIHQLCIILNVKYSNDAASATRQQINTMTEKGKTITAVFGIYKSKLIATKPSMDKSIEEYLGYEDVGTIFVDKKFSPKEAPLPDEVIDFWGREMSEEDIRYLEGEYKQFKKSNPAETYPEIVLLKNVCLTELRIKKAMISNDDIEKPLKTLQDLMKNLAISPNSAIAGSQKDSFEGIGMWIADVEKYEPCEWMKNDPRGDVYRDVTDVEGYFESYTVRPLKNFITASRDFNIVDEDKEEDAMYSGLSDEDDDEESGYDENEEES